jgi:undecaprenyl phosphate N,N'-diacetylbacillosamine 1-phosphate transferase
MYRFFLKRLLDFVVALILLLIVSPFLIPLAILLALTNRGTPFFIQSRPGKNAKIFKIIKFKTMTDKVDAHGNLLPDAERLTGLGKFVRKFSLDEIPQLINVVKGEMSLIGPRPLLIAYLPLYNDLQRQRHLVRPGITGWAQVNGRNAIGWKEKFEYDVYYVQHMSFLFDVKIFLRTLAHIIRAKGITQDGQATVEYFKGNSK